MNQELSLSLAQPQLIEAYESQDDWLQAQWDEATLAWLAAKQNKSGSCQTRRAYEISLKVFVAFYRRYRANPDGSEKRIWQIGGADVLAWQGQMQKAGLSPSSVNLRLAAVSSFFKFAATKFSIAGRSGKEIFLCDRNPVERVERAKIQPYGKVVGLEEDETLALLRRGCNRSTLPGLRNHALISFLIATGRRNGEALDLRWGDIQVKAAVIFYRWYGKGGEGGRRERGDAGIVEELARFAYDAIIEYLRQAGRLEAIQPDDHIWIAHSDVAGRLPNVKRAEPKAGASLSPAMVNRIVKAAARRAGLDASRIHTHTLRHAYGIMRLKMRGGDMMGVRDDMHHKNVNTTQIYVTAIKKDRDPLWQSVEQFFGMV